MKPWYTVEYIQLCDCAWLWSCSLATLCHYIDVIMTTMASQITSFTIVYSTVYSDADQRKHQSSASLAFVWGINRDRWIPRTKGQLRGKCFHLMTSSCVLATLPNFLKGYFVISPFFWCQVAHSTAGLLGWECKESSAATDGMSLKHIETTHQQLGKFSRRRWNVFWFLIQCEDAVLPIKEIPLWR